MKNLNVLIVEDEIPAQMNLKRVIEKNFDDLRIIDMRSSVAGAVQWLAEPTNHADIIFMDVELSDGMCFDIFARTQVRGKVVITTAYDNYAIRAFRINSIDYLLKPIDEDELRAAVSRCRAAIDTAPATPLFDAEVLRSVLSGSGREYKKRFVIKLGDKITVVNTADVAYFYAEDKSTYMITSAGRRLILDMSLDSVSEQVDPGQFFRISRNCTVSIGSIESISKHSSNRLKVLLSPTPAFEVFVSRSRAAEFMEWLQ